MSRTVFDRRFVSPCAGTHDTRGPCPRCGRELETVGGSPQRYCGAACRKAVARLPVAEREAQRAAVPDGMCVGCGVTLPAPTYRCPRVRNAAIKAWRAHSGGQLRFTLEWRSWLGEKLGLDPDDKRLPEIALQLAKAGKLTVLVDGDKVVGAAKPRPPQPKAARKQPERRAA